MYIFHDESGIFAPSSKPGSFSLVTAYILSSRQYRLARDVLRRYKLRNGWPIQDEFKRRELKGKEEPYFRLLEELGAIGGVLVAVGSDVSKNVKILDFQQEYADGLLLELMRNCTIDEAAIIREQAEGIRKLSPQNFTELACRVRLGWEVLQRAIGYYAQRSPGALRRLEWHYDYKDKDSHFDTLFKATIRPLMQRHAFVDKLQLIEGADYRHLGDALVLTSEGYKVRPGPLLDSMHFLKSESSDGVQLADLLANGLFGVLHNRFKDRERAATLLGKLMVKRPNVLLFPTMNYSDDERPSRTPEIESLMRLMRDVARPRAESGFPIRTVGKGVISRGA